MDFLIIILIAISLSMDAFSLSIAYGTIGFEKSKIYMLSIIVGIYHFFMPLMGNSIGNIILKYLFIKPNILLGLIFFIISIEMFFQKEEVNNLKNFISLLLFGFAVSIDSFSVGIGISTITDNHYLSYIIFSIISFSFTFIGLNFGKELNKIFGKYAIKLGSIMLLILGMYYIFN